MLRVCHSNRTEALLEALVANLRAERARLGPFATAALVVPNRNVADYVKLGIAQATGIAANLEVSFLRQHLDRIGRAAVPDAEVVGEPEMQGHLLSLLHDDAFLATVEPVRAYLAAAGNKADAIDRRRCQLAAELAPLFDEYALSRPQMLEAWADERLTSGWEATELWQRALWRAIRQRCGARKTLSELMVEAERKGITGGPLHVFGLSYVARGYHGMLATVARGRDVCIYTLNPCREFWEDLETVGELRRRLKKEGRASLFPLRAEAKQLALGDDPLGLQVAGESLALRLWARPGRENVRLLNQLTDGDFEGRFVRDDKGTLLGRLQNDILDRAAPERPDPALRADGSLMVLPCPGLRRELEVVAAEIWRLARQDPTLRLNDVAVVVPESGKDAYLSHVSAVFGESHGLPHNVVDLPLAGGHRLGEAAERLLDLPLGAFTRREVLPLITHPAVMARFPEATAQSWVHLCEELGIVHGLDRRDHEGSYVSRDLFSWDQGLRRLALGALMDAEPVVFGSDEYLPAVLRADDEASSLAFGLVARSLMEDVRFARGDGAPRLRLLPEWLDFMRGLLASYLVPADDEEAMLLARCQRALEELQAVTIAQPVSYRVAAELGRRALSRLGGSRGQYLASGVTVSSFVPMRAIPFRAVFVLGLGHGEFPRAARRSQLDLREARRQAGDVSPREQDLYMFLETLLCARERLVLSYVDRDELTGERLAPSSVLLELREVLGQLLPPDECKKLFDPPRPPLRRYDDDERLFASPLASRERVAKDLGKSLRSVLPTDASRPDWPALRRALPDGMRADLEARLSVYTPPPRAPAAGPERLVVPLAAIRQFLEDPLQGSARFRLRLREVEGDDEILERDEEAFATDALGRASILRDSFTRGLLSAAGWEAVLREYEALSARFELGGHVPTGLFRKAERPGHEAILRAWLDQVTAFAGANLFGRRLVRFGRAVQDADAGEVHAPIVLPIDAPVTEGPPRPLQIELIGRTELLIVPPKGATGSVVLVSGKKPEEEEAVGKRKLRGFVDHLALAAAGLSDGAHAAPILFADGMVPARFKAVKQAQARDYLASLVRDMLTGDPDGDGRPTGIHAYLLPCEAVFGARGKRSVAEEVERLRDLHFEMAWKTFSSVHGPVPDAVDRHEPPAVEDAERMAASRFGLYFELHEDPA